MKLNEVMTKDPEYARLNLPVIELARRMRDLDVGMLPVGDGVTLKGMVTDRDLALRVIAEGLDPQTVTASDIMTSEVLYAYEDEEVEKAIQTMREKQVRRLIILNRDKDLVGIVALADIATSDADAEGKAEAVKAVSTS
ncbi:MAG TPA: CBS domain-containing protein [Opitutales bacterium]|nr:CBS domain-containing protein [Opitutales bacterium]